MTTSRALCLLAVLEEALAGFSREPAATPEGPEPEEALVLLLTERIARDGEPHQALMPPFRLNRWDAEAVYDYLSILPRREV